MRWGDERKVWRMKERLCRPESVTQWADFGKGDGLLSIKTGRPGTGERWASKAHA